MTVTLSFFFELCKSLPILLLNARKAFADFPLDISNKHPLNIFLGELKAVMAEEVRDDQVNASRLMLDHIPLHVMTGNGRKAMGPAHAFIQQPGS